MPYQELFEMIYEIPCQHIVIFNDSCYSGSLLDLFKASSYYKKDEIIPL